MFARPPVKALDSSHPGGRAQPATASSGGDRCLWPSSGHRRRSGWGRNRHEGRGEGGFRPAGAPTPRDEVEHDWLPALLAAYERGDGYGFWAAEEKPSRAFVGWFHLRPAAGMPRDEPELGYRLVRSAWGRGLASEGARSLVDHAFADLGARRVVAECMAVHTASLRVMEKAGLRFVRAFQQQWPARIDGDEHGDVEYTLTREEWSAR